MNGPGRLSLDLESVKGPSLTANFNFCEVLPEQVSDIVKGFKSSNSCDIYGMSVNLLKEVIDSFVKPLTHCLNKCLAEGVFPEELKKSRVVPIYKKGDRDCPSSYRPISIVPVLAKILETIVYNQLSDHFERLNIIAPSQFGFRKNKSTVDALLKLTKSVLQAFEQGNYALATFCDISKGFDCVDHTILLEKMSYYGTGQNALKFLKSYLMNRSQLVTVGSISNKSSLLKVESGVPQGSILGPFLFLVAINDISAFVKTDTILYADDTTFFNLNSDLNILSQESKHTMEKASLWFNANSFVLNNSKTEQLNFNLKRGPPVNNPASVKFLGIHMDSKLTWEPHIKYVSSKLSRVIHLLRSLSGVVPMKYLRTAYFSFFHSIISYGLILWGNASQINDVLLIQKKALRIITNSSYLEHCKPLFINQKIPTVINLYVYYVLIYTHKNLSCLQLRSDVHSINTRYRNRIDIQHQRLTKSLNSFEITGQKLFNKLPSHLHNVSQKIFKQKIYSWLVLNPFYKLTEFDECLVNIC